MNIPLPDKVGKDDFEDRVISKLWPHMSDNGRFCTNLHITGGDFWYAMIGAISGCHEAGYRIPETLLQEIERENDECFETDDPIHGLLVRAVARVRSLDQTPQ
ncbi:MAG: hypothetical protein Q4P71_03050 [Actinomycetaceae bacterium]|nr:hypothetical protein [Actinomycetaceae bacterium]